VWRTIKILYPYGAPACGVWRRILVPAGIA
jgi:hypothetical protein